MITPRWKTLTQVAPLYPFSCYQKKKKKKYLHDKWEAIKLANELNDIRVIRIKIKKILQNDLRPL